MFVAINNKYISAIEIEGLIQRTRNDGAITPKFAMEILSLTNHRSNIKKLVRAIKDKCTAKEEILPYKDFIVSCVEEREVSEEALANLCEMATLCGCDKEFEEANGKPKFYGKFDCNNIDIKVVGSEEEFDALEGENLIIYFDAYVVKLLERDLSKVKAFKFKEGAKVDLYEARNLPKGLDVSMCSRVSLEFCDLKGLNLKFREGAEVCLWNAKNLPKDLDVSMCSYVDLTPCDLEGLNLKFREGAEVYLNGAKNLPKDLDVSMCSKVSLHGCDLRGLNLKFREGAEVDLFEARNLPKDLDVSMCSKVNMSCCNLGRVYEIKFRNGAEVDLKWAKNFPKYLDVSMCSKVDLYCCNLRWVKKIKFRDREQRAEFMRESVKFRGGFIYEEKMEKENNSVFSRIRNRFGMGGMGE